VQVVKALAPIASTLGQALVTVIKALAPELPSLAKSWASMAVSLAKILAALSPVIDLFAGLMAMGLGPFLKTMAKAAEALASRAVDDLQHHRWRHVRARSAHRRHGEVQRGPRCLDRLRHSTDGRAERRRRRNGFVSQRNIANDKQQIAAARNRTAEANAAKKATPKTPTTPAFKVPKFDVPTPDAPKLPAFDAEHVEVVLPAGLGHDHEPAHLRPERDLRLGAGGR
jgi:hypothetical protein